MLIPMLLEQGHHVHVVDNLFFGGKTLLPYFINPNFSFANVDVRDKTSLPKEVQDADAIIHLAALVGYPLCKKMPREAQEVNVDGTRNLLDCAQAFVWSMPLRDLIMEKSKELCKKTRLSIHCLCMEEPKQKRKR